MERCFIAGLFATIVAMLAQPSQAAPPERKSFDIDAPNLADALDRFSEQSGLQVVYDENVIATGRAVQMQGSMRVEQALDRMLAGSDLAWMFVSEKVVLVRAGHDAQHKPGAISRGEHSPARNDSVTTLSLVKVTEDSARRLAEEPTESAFGFAKPLIATPRSVSVITDDAIETFGLSAVEDLTVLAPGVFTTTRYGIQGSVDVRNVPADTYFRGMKRLTLQGHGRSVFAAMDTIEVVRGPPSPIDGLGKLGGFTNVVPKSGRARTGGYVQKPQGFTQLSYGTDERIEASFGLGGPLRPMGKQGGYYTYALLEDSDTYTQRVPVRQQVLQGALSIENFVGPFRLEAGGDYQVSKTSGALLNRVTQDLIDNNRYIRGEPLAMLDANGSGAIGYLEYARGSPVRGQLSPGNQPLVQRWAWPRDAQGNLLALDQRQPISGIPQSLYDYLVASCGSSPPPGSPLSSPPSSNACADPTGLLRAQGVGGPQPVSGYVPIGFALDPRTVGYSALDTRRAAAYEREIEAKFMVFFADLIYDENPDFTLKNQLFVDNMDQFKLSEQPSGGKQDVLVVADKLTATYRWTGAPSWLRLNALGSVIARETRSTGKRYSGDFGSHRTDAMLNGGVMTPNTSFVHPFDNEDLAAGGAPWTSHYASRYSELGAGVMFDVDLFDRTNVLAGGRIDDSEARNTDYAGTLDPSTGNSLNPGTIRTRNDSAKASDTGTSWNISLSHEIVPGIRPYVTYTRASLMLDNNNNSLDNAVIRTGHIGAAAMREIGIKGTVFDGRVYFSSALYDQWRSDGSPLVPSAQLSTDLTLTRTRGWETEIKWMPSGDLSLSLYALAQETDFRFSAGGNILVDARALGFQDVVDAQGNVIYPAEAFLYGGRAFLTLPSGIEAYEEKQGNPNVQLGLNATYRLTQGLGITFASTYVSSVHSGRLKLVELPEAVVFDAGLFFETRGWRLKLDFGNLFDERYFRARTGDTLGDTHVQSMPRRHCQMTLRYSF